MPWLGIKLATFWLWDDAPVNWASVARAPPTFTLATISSFSASLGLFLFHFVCLFVCFQIPHISEITWYLSFSDLLISLSIISSRSHGVTNDKISFCCVWLSHILFYHICIHSSFDGHLGCFHILAIVNNDEVNIGVHISFQTSVFFILFLCFIFEYPELVLLGHMVVLFLIFRRISILFSIVGALIYNPTDSVEGFMSFIYLIQLSEPSSNSFLFS